MKILFVCTGNTCRSPMAEGMLKQLAEKEGISLEVQSAGISALDGAPAAEHTETILKNRGISLEHSAQSLSPELLKWADVILTMTRSHKDVICSNIPEAVEKTFTIKEFAGDIEGMDIEDPYGGPLSVYQETEQELEQLLQQIMQKLRK